MILNKKKIKEKLKRFSTYKDGWNEKSSISPTEKPIKISEAIIRAYEIFFSEYKIKPAKVDVFPLNSGGINITFEISEENFMEIDLENNSKLSFLIENEHIRLSGLLKTTEGLFVLFDALHYQQKEE